VLKRKAFDSTKRFKENKLPYIESHRGCNKEEPENTLIAFQKAIEYNCDSIELDVWLTKDMIPVVIHGTEKGEISHTTTGTGIINEIYFVDLLTIQTKHKNMSVPTLEQVFRLCKGKIFINIEIKDANYSECFSKVLEMINSHDMKNQIAIASFKHQYWNEIKNKNEIEQIEFGFLYDTTEDQKCDIVLDSERKNSSINVWYKEVTEEFVSKAHEKNIAVHTWFKMDDPETDDDFKHLMNCGVDIICTNSPTRALLMRSEIFGL